MASGDYQVVFRGVLTGEHAEETVKQQLADLFGMPAQRIDALFSGKPVVVKKNVDRATAERFDQTFRKAGAVCDIRDLAGEPVAGESAGTSDAGTGTTAPAGGPSRADPTSGPVGSGRATGDARPGSSATAASGSVAAAGDPNRTVVEREIPTRFEGLQVDDSGAPLTAGQRPQPPQIDTGELSLADDDAGPLDPGERPPPADIDTSGLSIEAGGDAGEPGGTG